MPAEVNLRPEYGSFAELERACEEFCDLVNNRQHRVTRRVPADMLAEERLRLHPVAASPFTVAFGTTRVVPTHTPMISFENSQYSVPHQSMDLTARADLRRVEQCSFADVRTTQRRCARYRALRICGGGERDTPLGSGLVN